MLLLLFAVRKLDRAVGKSEAVGQIEKANWFAISQIHRTPYRSKVERGQTEPRWKTMIAFARKDCVLQGHLLDTRVRDWWEITTKGLRTCHNLLQHVAQDHVEFRRCNLWTPDFSKFLAENASRVTFQPTERSTSPDLLST
jgi:hypothetical protein